MLSGSGGGGVCDRWTVASNEPWVTVTAPSSSSGSGVGPITVGFTVAANATGEFRTASITVTASDGETGQTPTTFAITQCAVVTVAPGAIASAFSGVPYSQMFTATGGSPAHTFALGGSLPNGVTLASNGLLSGTPTETGTFGFRCHCNRLELTRLCWK